jgi:hypothetical protein
MALYKISIIPSVEKDLKYIPSDFLLIAYILWKRDKMNIYLKNRSLKITRMLLAFLILILTPFTFTACTNSEPQPPWSNAKVYADTDQEIIVNTGDKFIVRFTMSYNLYPIVKEIYDDNMITLLARKIYLTEEQNQQPEYSWFLFEALKPGETQITIQHCLHISESLADEKIFTVIVK